MRYPDSRNDPLDAMRAQTGEKTTYPVYQFDFRTPTEFTNEQREWIGRGSNSMIALGPTVVWDNRLPDIQKVVVVHWADGDLDGRPGAGRTTFMPDGSILMEFDPVGLHGELAWIAAAAHETGHVFGMDHVVGAPAIMNPTIPEVTLSDDLSDTDLEGSLPPFGPTEADFAEYDRANQR